jgi:hypothetical protein
MGTALCSYHRKCADIPSVPFLNVLLTGARQGLATVRAGRSFEVGQPADVGGCGLTLTRCHARGPGRLRMVQHRLSLASESAYVDVLRRLGSARGEDLVGMLDRPERRASAHMLQYLLEFGANPNDKPDGALARSMSAAEFLAWGGSTSRARQCRDLPRSDGRIGRGEGAPFGSCFGVAHAAPRMSRRWARRILFRVEFRQEPCVGRPGDIVDSPERLPAFTAGRCLATCAGRHIVADSWNQQLR